MNLGVGQDDARARGVFNGEFGSTMRACQVIALPLERFLAHWADKHGNQIILGHVSKSR